MSEETQIVMERADLDLAIKANMEEIHTLVDKYNDEVKQTSAATVETKAALDAMAKKSEELYERLEALEQRSDTDTGEATQSIGTQFIKSDEFEALQQRRSGSARVQVKTAIINAQGQNQPLVPDDRVSFVQTTPNRILRFRDLLPTGRTSSNLIQFPRENAFTNNAGPQVSGSPEAFENVTKPESAITFLLKNEPVVTLAHFIPVSKQLLDDAPAMEGYVNSRLMYGLRLKEEDQFLDGTGANGEMSGLNTDATAYTLQSPNLTNEIDIIRDAIKQAHVAEYAPNLLVLNPADWYDIEVRKVGSSDDRYVVGNPAAGLMAPRLWGIPVFVTNTQASGTFTVFDTNACMIFDRQDAVVEMSLEDSTNFQKNMATLRAESRAAFAIWRTEAVIKGSL